MREIEFTEVVEVWKAARGKDTAGILVWFQPPITTRWIEEDLPAEQIGELRFIGGDPGSHWGALTAGRYKVKEAMDQAVADPAFTWDPRWRIVTIRDPETGERTIIDGNARALQLIAAVARGGVTAETRIILLTGDLQTLIVRIAKAASSLWR